MSTLSKTPAKLIVSALAVVLLPTLAACGGSDKAETKKKDSSSASSYPTIDATPAAGTSIKGTGYTYKLPADWQDITSQLKASQPGIDSGGRSTPPTDPFTANLNTLTTPNQVAASTPTKAELAEVAAQIKQEITPLAPSIKQLDPVTVDGVTTVRQEGAASNSGAKFYIEQFWLVAKGSSYGFTFAFPTSTPAAQRDTVTESVLASVKFAG